MSIMNEPFLLSNLIDLQEIDNKIFKLEKDKKGSESVIRLMHLESEFNEITKKFKSKKMKFRIIIKKVRILLPLKNLYHKK